MGLSIDIFKSSEFSLMNLTNGINEMPFVPGQAGRLNVFAAEGISTTVFSIENVSGTLVLIPNTPRNAASNQNTRDLSKVRYFAVPHFPMADTILADEIQNVRSFGSASDLELAQREVDKRMTRITASHDATREYGMIGAIKGKILDADGSTIISDLFATFNITQTTVDFLFGTSTTSIVQKGIDVKNYIEDALGQSPYTKIVAFCGKTFFSNLINHATVKDAYKYYQTVQGQNPLRDDMRYSGFTHGDVTYIQYRGNVSGVPFIADGEAYAFPVGVPDLFLTKYAPANYWETVNTEGLPRYAKLAVDPSGLNKYVTLDTQSNPLSICTRPRVLIKLYSSN